MHIYGWMDTYDLMPRPASSTHARLRRAHFIYIILEMDHLYVYACIMRYRRPGKRRPRAVPQAARSDFRPGHREIRGPTPPRRGVARRARTGQAPPAGQLHSTTGRRLPAAIAAPATVRFADQLRRPVSASALDRARLRPGHQLIHMKATPRL